MRNPFQALFGELKSVTTSADLYRLLVGGQESASGSVVNEATALNVAAVLTCVSLRSRTLASLPVEVIERIDARTRRVAPDHPLSKVLLVPNGWQTRAELFGMLETHRVLRGNAYAWIDRRTIRGPGGVVLPNTPIELIPMHPDQVEVVEPKVMSDPTEYRLHRSTGGDPVPIPADEILHLKGLSTDGRKGRSVLQDLREAIGGAIATQDHAANFWKRDATPSLALIHPNELDEKAKHSLAEQWERLYAGRDRRRVAVLEEGMKIERLALTAEDSQFLQTREFSRGEIAGAFHVPPHMIGDTQRSTSWGTGIEQQQIGFLVFTEQPDLVVWEQRFQRDLISDPERFAMKFRTNGFMRGDSNARSTFYWRMRQMGAMSANEVRAFEDENPIPGPEGDLYLQPTYLAPLGFDPSNDGGTP